MYPHLGPRDQQLPVIWHPHTDRTPATPPGLPLATLVTAGPTIHGSVRGRDVHLFELPALSTTFVSAYLFSLNQSQLALFLCDPAITFDALCSAMNEALPSGVGLLAATHC